MNCRRAQKKERYICRRFNQLPGAELMTLWLSHRGRGESAPLIISNRVFAFEEDYVTV